MFPSSTSISFHAFILSSFIFTFLPIVIGVYYALSHLKSSLYQRLYLIAASLFFYGYYNVRYLALILVSIAVNYIIAVQIQNRKPGLSSLFLTIGVLFNVGFIGYFKYYDFFIENINFLLIKFFVFFLSLYFYYFFSYSLGEHPSYFLNTLEK